MLIVEYSRRDWLIDTGTDTDTDWLNAGSAALFIMYCFPRHSSPCLHVRMYTYVRQNVRLLLSWKWKPIDYD